MQNTYNYKQENIKTEDNGFNKGKQNSQNESQSGAGP